VSSPFVDEGPPLQVQGPVLVDPHVPLAVLQVWAPPQEGAGRAAAAAQAVGLAGVGERSSRRLQQPPPQELALQTHFPDEQVVAAPAGRAGDTGGAAGRVSSGPLLALCPLESQQPFGQ